MCRRWRQLTWNDLAPSGLLDVNATMDDAGLHHCAGDIAADLAIDRQFRQASGLTTRCHTSPPTRTTV
jgi:hypothetical protein